MKRVAAALLLTVATAAIAQPELDFRATLTKAQTGDADAEFAVAEAYRVGRDVPPDVESAIQWYRRAAAHGHVRASEELGFALFAHGDRREAMPYIEKAAARGEARAFYLLGTAHFNGDYAARDWPLAYAQTSRAAAAGLSAAQKNLELMGRYLLPSDRAKADQILATLPALRETPSSLTHDADVRLAAAPVTTASAAKPVKPAKGAPKISAPVIRKAAADAPAAGGPWKVQLGAFGTAGRARDRWRTLAAKVTRLGGYDQHVVAAGPVQRLQAGNVASKADAQALCKDVKAAGGDCLVIAP